MPANHSMEQTPVAAENVDDGTIRRCSSRSRYTAAVRSAAGIARVQTEEEIDEH